MWAFIAAAAAIGMVAGLLSVWAYYRGSRAGTKCGILAAKAEIQAGVQALAETRAVAEHCRAQWEDWERRAEGFRGINSGILTERDTWQNLYREQSAAHGNAQAMMMSAIDHLAGKLRQLGAEVPLPPVIAQVHQEFIHRHVTRVLPAVPPVNHQLGSQIPEKVQIKSPEIG